MADQQPARKDRSSALYNGIPQELRADGGTATFCVAKLDSGVQVSVGGIIAVLSPAFLSSSGVTL